MLVRGVAVALLLLPLLGGSGCALFQTKEKPPLRCCTPYHATGFEPGSMSRILVMPLANETPFPMAEEDIRRALATELQCLGKAEIVVAPCNPDICALKLVHLHGRFPESVLLELARTFRVDGILVGAITQYHPYPPPRIGMTLQLISPYEAVVVASVDGLWDARRKVVADDARAFYESNSYHWQFAQETDVGLSSPLLYQRYVCSRAVHELFTLPPPPQPVTAPEGKGQTAKADEPSPAKQGLNAKETNMTPSAKAKEEVPPPSAAGPPIDVETLPPPMAVPPESVQLTSGQR